MLKRLLHASLVVVFASAGAPSCAAQVDLSSLTGTVSDSAGQRIPAAHVVAVQVGTGLKRETVSSASGAYEIPDLPIGLYRVTCSAAGFQDAVFELQQTVGQTRTLNLALGHVQSELFLTVDADTKLAPDAIAAMRGAFAATPGLVAATGVLAPHCEADAAGRFFEWFQTYEYIRNFLGRYAWARTDSLLLISGAFAGFRRDAVITVGGFDPDCMVEDYELIHRLRRYGYDNNLGWHSTVLGTARALTSAPGSVMAFMRQRRRWFGGFLQTQLWYRDMVGAKKYSRLGTWMLPVKAVDTMQPIYGLCAFALLLWYIFTGRVAVLLPVGGIIFGKIAIDLAFHIWSIRLYRNWVGGLTKANIGLAILASIAEPFSFQLFRHLGACWGWVFFLTGQRSWGTRRRVDPVKAVT